MKTIYSILVWLIYGISFVFSLIFTFIAFIATFWFDKHRFIPNKVMMFFGRSMVSLNPFWTVTHFGVENVHKGPKGKIVIANHQSFLDMPLLATLPFKMKWVSKKELFNVPVVGWILKMSGHISVDRGTKNAAKSLLAMNPPIEDGGMVMIFPEGTRSREGKLKTFKKGAFYASKDNNFHILPIVVEGTYKLLPPDTWKMNVKGNLYISVLEPVDPSGFDTIESLSDHVHGLVSEELAKLQRIAKDG